MSVGEYCNREVVIATKGEPVREAVRLMRECHVGDIVVVSGEGDGRKPVGILTDRDIVVELLAKNVDLDAVNIGDVMSYELTTATEETGLLQALELMRNKGVRRLPIVNTQGDLVGLLSTDDILELVAEQLSDIVGLISHGQKKEAELRQ